MEITDIHAVTISYCVGDILLEQKISNELFQHIASQKYVIEQSVYIAISKTFLELAQEFISVFSEKPHNFVFTYRDADNYKHIMSL